MNIWANAVITQKGLALQSKLISGTTLNITKVQIGAGYTSPVLLPQQEEIIDVKKTLSSISGISYPEEGKCAININITNDDFEQGFTAKQIGIFANDPDEGEILYFIAQAENEAGTIVPSKTEMPGYSAEWTFYFQYGQADNVIVQVDPSNTVTQTSMKNYIESIKGVPGGVASLGNDGKVPVEQLNQPNFDTISDLHAVDECRIVQCDQNTENTPYKAGLTYATHGTCIVSSTATYKTLLYMATSASEYVFFQSCQNGKWGDWQAVSVMIPSLRTTLYVSATGNDTAGDGTLEKPFASLTKALSVIPKNMGGQTITINVSSGIYDESNVAIDGFYGGRLLIVGTQSDHPVFTQGITVNKAEAQISFRYIDSRCTESRAGFVFNSCPDVHINECTITGDGSGDGVFCCVLATVHIYGCAVNNANVALCCERGHMYVAGAQGTDNKYAAVAGYGGIINIDQSLPAYTVAAYFTICGGRIYRDAQANVPKY